MVRVTFFKTSLIMSFDEPSFFSPGSLQFCIVALPLGVGVGLSGVAASFSFFSSFPNDSLGPRMTCRSSMITSKGLERHCSRLYYKISDRARTCSWSLPIMAALSTTGRLWDASLLFTLSGRTLTSVRWTLPFARVIRVGT